MSTNSGSVGEVGVKAGANPTAHTDSATTARRLQSELMSLMVRRGCSADAGISAFPDGDNIFAWVGTIQGGAGTVYEGLTFKLSLYFPSDYPFTAPVVKFEAPGCFHPNVDLQHGHICLDVLKEKWSAVHNIRTILLSIQSLLGEPNNESPLNGQAASLWANQEEYRRVLLKRYEAQAKA